ncbi:MAG: PAS domain S-box protein [Dehalococcoidales bacterium]|nr:PAS domain S-box protein [Dehalococcoidales bacterium]
MAQNFLDPWTLARIVENYSIPSFVINKDHRVICWNTAMEALSGIRKNEIIGTSEQWRAFYKRRRPVMADLIVEGAVPNQEDLEAHYGGRYQKSRLIEGAYEAEDFFPELGEDGKWLRFTASPIKDDDGNIIGAIETLEDITERKRAEQALAESERSYRMLFEDARDAIWLHDLKGNISAANQATAALTGYTREELLRMNIRSLLSESSLATLEEVGRKLLQSQRVAMPYEISVIRHNGTQAICMVATNLVIKNDKPSGFQNIARDVTQERRLQAELRYYLKEITRAQEEERKRIARELHDDTAQLLGSLARQLDNFIRHQRGLSPEDISFLQNLREQINRGVQDVHRFIQDLLPPILDVLGLVPAIRALINDLHRSEGLNTELKVLGEERRLSSEVELLLYRIIQEGLNNIIKHARTLQAQVTVEFSPERVRAIIADSGCGFELARLHEAPRSGRLGLTGMQERTQLLGGTLEIKSAPGRGTTLTVEVPVQK